MVAHQRIFVGSSMEAEGLAERVAQVISDAGMEPVLWRTIFPAGEIILGGIERLANSVDAAVLVATPDIACVRGSRNEHFSAPVANIVFEYGYLSARLSRGRVAICTFDGAEMPSDLQGLTVVRCGGYAGAATTLSPTTPRSIFSGGSAAWCRSQSGFPRCGDCTGTPARGMCKIVSHFGMASSQGPTTG
jgi:hypothetical protein